MNNEEKIIELKEDLKKAKAVEVFALSDGGKLLLKNLSIDIISNIETLANKYSTLTIQEFISLGASTKEKMSVFKAVNNSKRNKKFLEDMLQETLNEQ